MTYSEIVKFHGHACPGLAIGYRMASAALKSLAEMRAQDEELVSIVENDACGVDALQCLTGCTFGKGNLLFRDYGKQVYTIYARATRQGVRVVFHGSGVPDSIRDDRDAFMDWILTASQKSMISVAPVTVAEPEPAQIRKSVLCDICNESVMETRIRQVGKKDICIPCYQKLYSREEKN